MATFSEIQVTDLAEILETNSDMMGAHLDFHATIITEADKTKVLARITEWQAIANDSKSMEPVQRNFGTRDSSNAKRSLIASRIASLLNWQQSNDVLGVMVSRG